LAGTAAGWCCGSVSARRSTEAGETQRRVAPRARANGQNLGRKPKLTISEERRFVAATPARLLGSIVRSYNVSPSTISRLTI
jgi:hypothetical protein